MPSTLEQQFLKALAKSDLITAHLLLEQLATECSESHLRVLRAHYRAHLSPCNLPGSFIEMMEASTSRDLSLWTGLFICVEGSRIAFRLLDVGRMRQVLRFFKRLQRQYPADPELLKWTGHLLLNQANLAALTGDRKVIPLYSAAARALAAYEPFWCKAIAAHSRLAVAYEYAGRPRDADRGLATAQALLRDDVNRQEVLLARARILLCRGQVMEAITDAGEAYRLARLQNDHFVAVEALRCSGQGFATLNQQQEAAVHFAEARQIAMRHCLYYLVDGFWPKAEAR